MVTALIGAVIAAAAAVFAAVMSWSAARRARQSSDRTHAWTRITWAVDVAPDDPPYDISRTVLLSMRDLRWAPKDDRELAAQIASPHTARGRGTAVPTTEDHERNEDPDC